MRNIIFAGAAAMLLLPPVAAGYAPLAAFAASPAFAETAGSASHGRKVLYWQHPDGRPDYASEPKRTEDGRDFVPVYEEAEQEILSPKPVGAGANRERKVLYYRNPMGLPDTSPTPKKDWMGMDYIPVYEGDDQGGASVTVSLDKVQRAGVRTEKAQRRVLVRPIRAPAVAKPDERSMYVVALRADAFVEKLYVNETGKHVTAGEPLFRIYSPQMVTAQINYQVAARDRSAQGTAGAERQLENLEIPADVLARLSASGEPVMSIDWPSPVTGVVMEKRVIEGQMARMGDELFRFADLTHIWVIADVPEQDLALVALGMTAKVRFTALPTETFEGKVTFVLHELDASTRTAKVRIEVANPEHRIRHEMYAEVEIEAGTGSAEKVSVPISAVIDDGTRNVVLVARGEGRFEPRDVKLGIKGDAYVEIVQGVAEGESVVVSANFLIDAESNLKAALSGFSGDTSQKTPEPEHRK